MAHAEAEHETAVGLLGECVGHLLHRAGMPVEDRRDPSGEHEVRGAAGEMGDVRERIAADGVGQPQGGVPEPLDPPDEIFGLGEDIPSVKYQTPSARR